MGIGSQLVCSSDEEVGAEVSLLLAHQQYKYYVLWFPFFSSCAGDFFLVNIILRVPRHPVWTINGFCGISQDRFNQRLAYSTIYRIMLCSKDRHVHTCMSANGSLTEVMTHLPLLGWQGDNTGSPVVVG